MLRAALLRRNPASVRSACAGFGGQWQATRSPAAPFGQRYYADTRKPDATVGPGLTSRDAKSDVPPAPTTSPTNPGATTPLKPEVAPKASPTSGGTASATATQADTLPPTGTGASSTAPPASPPSAQSSQSPPPPPPPKKPSRFRRWMLSLLILSGLGYGGGVYYALISDNWHDFFTEYVPYGEDAVGFFEEREFRRRFPSGDGSGQRLHTQVRGENKVTIPSRSGMSWKVSEGEEKGASQPAAERKLARAEGNKGASPSSSEPTPHSAAVRDAEKPTQSQTHQLMPKEGALAPKPATKEEPKPAEPSKPVPTIDHIAVPEASEAAVQDVVKILNDIIATVNADGAASKFSSVMAKAKDDVDKVAQHIATLKSAQEKAAEEKIRSAHSEFDEAAKELVRRLETEMHDQETHWREEYEAEREKLSSSYQEKLKTELAATQRVHDQKLQNELLAQAIALQRQFAGSVEATIESERDGRLGRLRELEHDVQELESLTAAWNNIVDANLRTQHLHVALEAVRERLAHADRPQPFLAELAALKEIGGEADGTQQHNNDSDNNNNNAVVAAAIASIHPHAYQRGVPTQPMLVDRFRRVAAEVRKAALLPDAAQDAGATAHLASWALSKLTFRKDGVPPPTGRRDDVENVIARAEGFLEEGRLDEAAREVNALRGWAKVLAGDWLQDVRRVCEVQQALDVIATEARLQSLLVE